MIMLLILALVLCAYFWPACPKMLKDNKQILLGVVVGLVLCTIFKKDLIEGLCHANDCKDGLSGSGGKCYGKCCDPHHDLTHWGCGPFPDYWSGNGKTDWTIPCACYGQKDCKMPSNGTTAPVVGGSLNFCTASSDGLQTTLLYGMTAADEGRVLGTSGNTQSEIDSANTATAKQARQDSIDSNKLGG